MTITRIRGWNDPGFTEDGPEAPHYGYTLPAASKDLTLLAMEPSKDRVFSEFKIGGAVWEEWKAVSFIEVTYAWNNSLTSTVLYGFVDEVELLSDTDGSAAVRLRWHVDEWMTYLGSARLGFGHVLRRPVGSADPIQSYERKRWYPDSYSTVVPVKKLDSPSADVWWVLLAFGETTPSQQKVVSFLTYPVGKDNEYLFGLSEDPTPIATLFPGLSESIMGRWDELLGLDPNAIYGAWLLPCPPMGTEITGIATASNPLVSTTNGWIPYGLNSGGAGKVALKSGWGASYQRYDDIFPVESSSFGTAKVPTEMNPIHILGFTGESIGELPIGGSYKAYTYRVIASATECYVEVRFDGDLSRIEGTCFSIPALPLDLTENAWSSYQYSGQRRYDIDARNNQSIKSGIEAAASGAMTGALMGGFGPMGAAAGALGGAISGGVSLATDFLWFNEAEQGLKDRLAANQTPGILLSGGAWDAMFNGSTIRVVTLKMDTYSKDRADSERSLVGVKVDEYISSNDTVRSSTGFYQIVNLVVGGSVPNSARRAIANRFAKGVKLI